MKTWLYIGRFQPFHNGHKLVVDTMLREVDAVVICIWLSEWEEKNPYDYNTRLHFFTHLYSNISHIYFFPLADEESDSDWINNILELPYVSDCDKLILYCGDIKHDSAVRVIKSHSNMFVWMKLGIKEIPRDRIPVSWTEIRRDIISGNFNKTHGKIPDEVSEILKNWIPRIDF